MTPAEAELVQQRYWEGWSLADIASHRGVAKETVRLELRVVPAALGQMTY